MSLPTHRFNHTLDLVIIQTDSILCSVVSECPISPSDHFPILYSLNISRPPSSPVSKHLTRAIHSINVERFARDIFSSRLITHPPSDLSDLIDCYNSTLTNLLDKHPPSDLIDCYNSTLTNLLDKHAPLLTKIICSKPSQPWFTPALNKLKSSKRRLERAWFKSHSSDDLKLLRSAANHYHAAVIKAVSSN